MEAQRPISDTRQIPAFRAPSFRLQAVQAPVIPLVAEAIRANPGTISLGQGVVHYPPPPEAVSALRARLGDPALDRYGHVAGVPALVEAIQAKLEHENGLVTGGDRHVVVTAGGNMAFMNAVLAITDPGDEIVIPSPYYFNHEMAITMSGAHPVVVPTDASFQLRPDAIRAAITPRTRAVVTVSPNNPTGAVYPEAALRAVHRICRTAGLYHIHDAAYEYFTYDDAASFSPGALDGAEEMTISLFSLSKAYGFAGWRIGYMVVPDHLMTAVRKIQDTILICPPRPSQAAALGALEAGAAYCLDRLPAFDAVRRRVCDALRSLGDRILWVEPKGAFYAYVRVPGRTDSMALVRRLIAEHGVAVLPGVTFGDEDPAAFRIAYGALEEATVAEALGRLVEGLVRITDEEE